MEKPENGHLVNLNIGEENAPPLLMNEETARYLWNLTQKSNLNLTIIAAKTSVEKRNEKDFKINAPQNSFERTQLGNIDNNSGQTSTKQVMVNPTMESSQNSQTSSTSAVNVANPFAALPLSLIKSGILSVTSESACVKIENGVPILKETSIEPESIVADKSSVYMEPIQKSTNAEKPTIKENLPTDPELSPLENVQTKTAINFAQLQKKVLLQRRILKTLMKPPRMDALPINGLMPNPNQLEFSALLGLEIVTQEYFKDPTIPHVVEETIPQFCVQCRTDFSPRWYLRWRDNHVICHRCFSWNKRLKVIEERTKQLQHDFVVLRKHLKLPIPKVKLQTPEELPYINTRSPTMCTIAATEVARLGAFIASSDAIQQALNNLESLSETTTAETLTAAIQNVQKTFNQELFEAFKHILINQRTIDNFNQSAQNFVNNAFNNSKSSGRENPLQVFEMAISASQRCIIKMMQSKNAQR